MRYPATICLSLLLTLTILSCQQKAPKETKYIPKDISLVLAADPKTLQDKLEHEGISMDTLIERMFNKGGADSTERQRFMDIKNASGINWTSKLYVFTVQKADEKLGIYSVMASIKDPAAFESQLKKQICWQVNPFKNQNSILILFRPKPAASLPGTNL